MDVNAPLPLLGGLSPAQFMRRHWQKQPLLVRQALPGVVPPLPRAALFALAAQDDVESRLVQRIAIGAKAAADSFADSAADHAADHAAERAAERAAGWRVRPGPLPRRTLPPLSQPGWTLLVQGLDLHVSAAHALLQHFRFVPDARLDDLMVSWASDGGGVGPHLDSYDVFLLQLHGRRRWRVAPVPQPDQAPWVEGAPLKILQHFEPVAEWLLEPGDMLYLPPGWAHDGVAEGECMTGSIGFRAPARDALAAELLQRLAETALDEADPAGPRLYRDPRQAATDTPGAIPPALLDFAQDAVRRLLAEPGALARCLGEVLSEPKPQVWFRADEVLPDAAGRGVIEATAGHGAIGAVAAVAAVADTPGAVVLDRATRMLHDAQHIFINGEAFLAAGRDARLMRRLADARQLDARETARLSTGARALLHAWRRQGWLHAVSAKNAGATP